MAAGLVLLFHAGVLTLKGGFLGVDIFFVLSGFLVTRALLGEQVRTGTVDFVRFWSRRVTRLLPALVVLLAACCAWVSLFPGHDLVSRTRSAIPLAALNLSNWKFASDGPGGLGVLAHTWSLAFEWQFYLVLPVLLIALRKRGLQAPHLALLVVATVILVAAWRATLWQPGASAEFRMYAGFDTRADAPLLGALIALVLQMGFAPRTSSQRRAVQWGGGVGMLLLAFGVSNVVAARPYLYRRGGYLVVAMAAAFVIYSLVTCPPPFVGKALRWRPLVGLGRISYSLYLWHFPVTLMMRGPRFVEWPRAAVILADCVLSVGLALLSYNLVERPAMNLMNRGRARRPLPTRVTFRPVVADGLAPVIPIVPRLLSVSRMDEQPTAAVGDGTA